MGKFRDFLFPTKEKDVFETTIIDTEETKSETNVKSNAMILDDNSTSANNFFNVDMTPKQEENKPIYNQPTNNEQTKTNQDNFDTQTITMTAIHNIPQIHKPKEFAEVEKLANRLLEGKSIIVSLVDTDKEVSRRICDFLNGVCFALNGYVQKVEKRIYLFSPSKDE